MKIAQSAGYNTKCQTHVQAVTDSLKNHIFDFADDICSYVIWYKYNDSIV